MPFYVASWQRDIHHPLARVVVVVGDPLETGQQYLEDHNVKLDQVLTMKAGELRVSGT
jgi:hypothetical protein